MLLWGFYVDLQADVGPALAGKAAFLAIKM